MKMYFIASFCCVFQHFCLAQIRYGWHVNETENYNDNIFRCPSFDRVRVAGSSISSLFYTSPCLSYSCIDKFSIDPNVFSLYILFAILLQFHSFISLAVSLTYKMKRTKKKQETCALYCVVC